MDYSDTFSRDFESEKKRIEYGIQEEEIGEIEEAAFNIIRLRQLPDMPKAHMIMRSLAKYCRTRDGKREIKTITRKVEHGSPRRSALTNPGIPWNVSRWTPNGLPRTNRPSSIT